MADDLVAVLQAVGFDRFFVLGYSLSGVFAPWIAHLTGRAEAVVSAGFPIVGDYRDLRTDIERWTEEARSDPAASAYLEDWGAEDEEIAVAGGTEQLASGLRPARAAARVVPGSSPRRHAGSPRRGLPRSALLARRALTLAETQNARLGQCSGMTPEG
jgi:pimeloyl-ACP methyl ester carboxylesterase